MQKFIYIYIVISLELKEEMSWFFDSLLVLFYFVLSFIARKVSYIHI